MKNESLYEKAKKLVRKERCCKSSLLQRRFKISYVQAAYLLELLEDNEVIAPAIFPHERKILKNND